MRRIAWVGISFLLTAACHGSCASSGGTHDDAGDAALDVGRDTDHSDAGDLPDVRPDAVDVEDASTDAGDADTTNDGGDADASVDPEMTVDPSNVTLAEGGMPATVSLTLLSRPTDAVTITPLAHSDIQATSITIQPMEWDQPHDLMIEAIDDVIAELTETHEFALEASSVDDTFDGQQVVVDAEVEDNDSPEILVNRTSTGSTWSFDMATFEVWLGAAPARDVVVEAIAQPRSTYAAPSGLVFTPQNWDQPQTLAVGTAHTSYVEEFDSTVDLRPWTEDPAYQQLSGPQVVNHFFDDDDFTGIRRLEIDGTMVSEGAPSRTIDVEVDLFPCEEYLVDFRSSAPNRVSIEPAQLRLNAGSCAMSPCAGQAEVTVEQDNTISPTEWVAIGVHYVCSAPHIPIYYDESTSFTLLATDDDERNLASTMSALELNERRAPRACTRVALSVPPTAPVTIPVESSDTTAFIPETTTLTFDSTNWYEPRTICVHSVDDSQPDGTQQASLRFAPADSTDPGYDGFDGDDLPVRVTDDETPGVTFHTNTPHVRPSRGAIRGGLTAIFTNTAPTGAVDLSLSSSQPTDIEDLDEPVGWDWVWPHTPMIDDDQNDGARTVAMSGGAATSTDPDYDGLVPAGFDVVAVDLDVPGAIQRTPNDLDVNAGGNATFAVSLTSQPTGNVEISLEPSDPTNITLSTAVLVFDPSNWDSPQLVTVTAVDGPGQPTLYARWIELGPAVSTDPQFDGETGRPLQVFVR